MSQPSPLRAALRAGDALLKSNEAPHALKVVADALRGLALSPAEVDKAGRWLRKALSSPSAPPPSLRVYLLGQITTSWLTTALMAEALQRGALIWVDEAGYDQILQESLRPIEADVVVLLPWSKRLVEGADAAAERVALEVGFWRQVWANLEAQAVGRALRLIQVGYDLVSAGAEGVAPAGAPGGALDRVAQVNAALRAALPSSAYFLDLGYLAGEHGRRAFYDPRRYHWTKQPFSELGVVALAAALWAGVRALLTGPKKVLVLDLDNTLWGGVVGDEGPLGIVVGGGPDGEAFAAFQRHCKALSARGVLLAVASKNHPEDAREPFEVNPEMQLRLSDFAAFEASWAPKSLSLTHMAQTLRLGLDAFVFFDDNPAERALIQAHLPEVEVVDVPPDPAEYIRALEAGRWFEAAQITTADQARAAQYQLEGARRALEAEAGSLDDYLASLQMRGAVADLHDADTPRAVQLLGKTNQFNLTTRRHDQGVLAQMRRVERAILLTLRVADRFGDHGLVSVILALPDVDDPSLLVIDSWLMSCRVIARGVEVFFFNTLVQRARALGYSRIFAARRPTQKNALISGLLPALGFTPTAAHPTPRFGPNEVGVSESFILDLDGYTPPQTFVEAP